MPRRCWKCTACEKTADDRQDVRFVAPRQDFCGGRRVAAPRTPVWLRNEATNVLARRGKPTWPRFRGASRRGRHASAAPAGIQPTHEGLRGAMVSGQSRPRLTRVCTGASLFHESGRRRCGIWASAVFG
jgi:hypothetical protein